MHLPSNEYPPPVLPVINENLLLPDVIDFNLRNNPNQPFYVFADSDSVIRVITHLEFSRAAHRVAYAVSPGRIDWDGKVVGIVAETDIVLYQAIVAGLIVAGLVPFTISPRNPPAVIAELLRKTSCHRLLTTNETLETLLHEIRACLSILSHGVRIEEIPALAVVYPHLASECAQHPFEPFMDSLPASASDICIILHSSGSTGTPKAVAQTHLQWIQSMISPELREYVPRLVLGSMSLPSFHCFGLAAQLFMPSYWAMSAAVFPPTSSARSSCVPSPQNVLEHARLTKTNALFTIPAFISVWSTSASAIDYLKQLEFLGYGGGPLPPKIGNELASVGVRLSLIYGGSEFGIPTSLVPTEDVTDWEYKKFSGLTKVRWIPQGDGTFECHLLACETYSPVVNNLDDVEGFATGDIFKPHPVRDGLWKIVGRVDDIIIHSSGEKTVPGPMEAIIVSNVLVKAAVIFGRERDHPGVLIELRLDAKIDVNDQAALVRLRDDLWPTIEEANNQVPAFSKIFKEMLLFTSVDKPLPRTAKGTVMRKAAYDLYASEISALYESVDIGARRLISWNIADSESWLVEQAAELTSRKLICPVTDLFYQGFDSLSATILRRRIAYAMRSSDDPSLREASRNLPQNLIYNARTIASLALYMTTAFDMIQATSSSQRVDAIESLIIKYGRNLIPLSLGTPDSVDDQVSKTVLLTGSTGHLGSQILANLLRDSRVRKIYAFNRPGQTATSLLDRHAERFKDIGLDLLLLDSPKLVLVTGDSTHSNLRIDKGLYSEICSSVNIVIHSAWRVDFNLPLLSYEPNIQSTRNLIDLARASPTASQVRFLFISSITSAQSWDTSRGPVPEEIIGDGSFAIGSGYGEGKYVVERMLAMSGLQTTTLRLGQVCGGQPKGSWPINEWIPIIVKSSVTVGVFPNIDGVAQWLFADAASSAVVDIALSPLRSLPQVLNLVHPRPVDQSIVFNGICKALKDVLNRDLQVVPFMQWISIIKERGDKANLNNDVLEKIPAIKLIEFLNRDDNIANQTFSTEKIQSISQVLVPGRSNHIEPGDAVMWVRYWYSVGFLN